MKRYHLLPIAFILLLALLSCGARFAPACPSTQAGQVTGTLSPEGYTILYVDYACDWPNAPIMVASPTGQGSLFVERFEANALTGGDGSIAVKGEPGAVVSFTWVAVEH